MAASYDLDGNGPLADRLVWAAMAAAVRQGARVIAAAYNAGTGMLRLTFSQPVDQALIVDMLALGLQAAGHEGHDLTLARVDGGERWSCTTCGVIVPREA